MDPNIWGPNLWVFLHTMSFNYPQNPSEKDINTHIDFFNSLVHILPCSVCKDHYSTFIEQNPVKDYLNNRESIIRWVLKCHNNVNKLNNKNEWNYDMLIRHYSKLYNTKSRIILISSNNFPIYVILIFIIGILLYKMNK